MVSSLEVVEALKDFYEPAEIDNFFKILKTAPKISTVRVNTLVTTRDQVIHDLLSYFASTVPFALKSPSVANSS